MTGNPLRNYHDWNGLCTADQDKCIREVVSGLAPHYFHVETQVYECSDRSFRIATVEHKRTGIFLNLIPGGTYTIGSPISEIGRHSNETQVPNIYIPPFLVGRTTVSQRNWDAIGGYDARVVANNEFPIESVSWHAVKEWLGRAGDGLRLLSDTEWEYACRATTTTTFHFGDNITTDQVNYNGFYPYSDGETGIYRVQAVPIGSLPPNAFGLHEMHGNVWEWCEDNQFFCYPKFLDHKPRYFDCVETDERVIRGGAWGFNAESCRSAHSSAEEPHEEDQFIGFRVARSIFI